MLMFYFAILTVGYDMIDQVRGVMHCKIRTLHYSFVFFTVITRPLRKTTVRGGKRTERERKRNRILTSYHMTPYVIRMASKPTVLVLLPRV